MTMKDIIDAAFGSDPGGDGRAEHKRLCEQYDIVDAERTLPGRVVPHGLWGTPASDNGHGFAALKRNLSNPAKLKRDIDRLVRSQEKVSRKRGQKTGRFDTRRIARALNGCETVYTRRSVTEGETTAVCFLIDQSGSMADGRIKTAKTLAAHMSEICHRAGVPFEIAGFDQAQHGASNYYLVKSFSDRFNAAAKQRLADMAPGGGTTMSPQMLTASIRLAEQNADKRLLIVLCDGCEGGTDGRTIKVGDRCKTEFDVDVIGIGCQYDVSKRFRVSQSFFRLDALVKGGLDLIVKALSDR